MPSAREVVESHMGKFEERATVEEILEDYAPDAFLEMAGNRIESRQNLGDAFAATMAGMGEANFTDVVYTEHSPEWVEVGWSLGPMEGGDLFRVVDGLVREQRVWMGARPDDFTAGV